MRRLKILHRTYYNFRGSVQLQPHRLLLRPREGPGLHIEFSKLDIAPAAQIRWLRDAYDNSVAIATFASPTTQLAIVSECIVQQFDEAPLDFLVADFAVNYPFIYDAESAEVLRPYLHSLPQADQAALGAWVRRHWPPIGEPVQTYGLLARLCAGINHSLIYQVREEPGVQSAVETLTRGIGSCRARCRKFAGMNEQMPSLDSAILFHAIQIALPPSCFRTPTLCMGKISEERG